MSSIIFSILMLGILYGCYGSFPARCPGLNEFFACGSACDTTCATLEKPCDIINKKCVERCYCKNGYARNEYGVCIPIEDCPNMNPVCTKLEVLDPCSSSCPPEQTCETYFRPVEYLCAQPLPDAPCISRCKCIAGYIRNSKGLCIKPEQCCEDPNAEVVDCPNPCPHSCDDTQIICRALCQPRGCQCKNGYILSKIGGKCIKFSKCPNPLCKGPNEEYKNCRNPCPETCESINNSEPQPVCSLPRPCPGGCDCLPGYVRDENYICIKKENCPSLKCKEHEVYVGCPGYCQYDEDCGTYFYGIIKGCPPPPEGNYPCKPRCYCKEGYLRIDGTCQLPINCCNDPNSQVVDCPVPCDKTCDGNDVPNCFKDCLRKACRCIPGLVKNENGLCIPKEKCPNNCGENEEYKECGTACQPTCSKRDPICILLCKSGCFCKKGYIRDSNGKCIKITDCPPQCKPNEVLNPCPKRGSIDADCKSHLYGIVLPGPPPSRVIAPCKPRCECKPGFVRVNGICVSADICCNDVNAEVLDCPARCQEECFAGPTDVISCVDNCKGRVCRCKKGFLYDITKKCVAPKDCIPKLNCKANEVYNRCPKPCRPGDISYCSEYITNTPLECLPVKDFKCLPRCDCIKDYLRDKKGVCVKKENCCDDPNAVPVKCPSPCPKTCNNLGTHGKIPCAKMCTTFGCTCRDGFVQDANGKCIKPEHCPKKCKLPNEEYKTCGPSCEPSCEDRNPITSGKCIPGCFCKKGFLRKNGECVEPSCCCDNIQ